MTADSVRAYLEAQGWKSTAGGGVVHLATLLVARIYENGDVSFSTCGVPAPVRVASPADLAALLRCLGAPAKDDGRHGTYTIEWTEYDGSEYIKYIKAGTLAYDGPERRVADHPEAIPCKLCGAHSAPCTAAEDDRSLVWCPSPFCRLDTVFPIEEWERLVDRRRSGEGK